MRWLKRPETALVVALVALAGTWGGPAVARVLVTGKDVRNRSLSGKDLKSNSVTGRVVARLSGRDVVDDGIDGTDILERSLGVVPRANAATSADTLAGLRLARVAFKGALSTPATTVFDAAGLKLDASCAGAGTLSVTASATAGGGFVRVSGTRVDSRGVEGPVYGEDDELVPGEQFNVLAGASDDAAATLTWFGPGGEVVTLPFLAESGVIATRGFACLFAGTATITPAG